MNTTTRNRPRGKQRKDAPTSSHKPLSGLAAMPEASGPGAVNERADPSAEASPGDGVRPDTPICRCIQAEMERYFDLLDGQAPHDLYRMVMQQAEQALLAYVMEETRHNQSKAASWLGISRGTLRGKLADMPKKGTHRS